MATDPAARLWACQEFINDHCSCECEATAEQLLAFVDRINGKSDPRIRLRCRHGFTDERTGFSKRLPNIRIPIFKIGGSLTPQMEPTETATFEWSGTDADGVDVYREDY